MMPSFTSGGATLDHEDPRVVYLSRRVGTWHQVELWFTGDRGRTWSTRQLTDDRRLLDPPGLPARAARGEQPDRLRPRRQPHGRLPRVPEPDPRARVSSSRWVRRAARAPRRPRPRRRTRSPRSGRATPPSTPRPARRRRAAPRARAASPARAADAVGRWVAATIPLPTCAINAVLLPTGKVAFWGAHRCSATGARTCRSSGSGTRSTGGLSRHDAPRLDLDGDGDRGRPRRCSARASRCSPTASSSSPAATSATRPGWAARRPTGEGSTAPTRSIRGA